VTASPAPPRLRDRDLQAVLLVVLGLQVLSWSTLDGYQLADSVEYMEHAQAFVRGQEVIDSHAIRAFGFSALLTPVFAAADLLGVEDFRPVVHVLRALQVLLGLLLARACARIGARLAGRRAGLAAALLVGFNPIFLQYTVSPVSGVAAALCIGQALDGLTSPHRFRRGLGTGLWLGAALLMAYQTIIIAVPLLALLMLRHLRRAPGFAAGGLAGYAIGALAAMALDLPRYGSFGRSLHLHFAQNFGGVAGRIVRELGFVDLAARLMEYGGSVQLGREVSVADPLLLNLQQRMPVHYYFSSIQEMLAWPVLVLLAAGLWRSLRRPGWTSSILVTLLVLNAGVMSFKGSKDFRLWLPLLPMIAPLCALGLRALVGGPGQRHARLRALAAWSLVFLAGCLGADALLARNTQRYAGYWRAMDCVNRIAREEREEGREGPPLRVACAWYWAAYLRSSADVELVKLPHHLDGWRGYSPRERERTLEALRGLDCFIAHMAVLAAHPTLMEAVNGDFGVHTLTWDREVFEDLGPILILQRCAPDAGARRFFEVVIGQDPASYRERWQLSDSIDFVSLGDDGATERLRLLGWDHEILPGSEHGWLTYHWYCAAPLRSDYRVLDRMTTEPGTHAWQNDHPPAHGLRPTSSWEPGWIVREGWPVVAAAEPFDWRSEWRPLGAGHPEDRIDADLWISVVAADRAGRHLWAARPGESEPIRRGLPPGTLESADGHRFDAGGRVCAGRFSLPVGESARALRR